MTGDEWIALFVVTDAAQLDHLEWLENRQYTPGRPSRPFALLSLVPTPAGREKGVPVFDFSDYERGLNHLAEWLGERPTIGGDDVTRGDTVATDSGAGEARPYAPIEELERFEMSEDAGRIVRYGLAMAPFYIAGTQVLFSELLVFGAVESGRVKNRRFSGFFWQTVKQSAGAEYEESREYRFPQWVPDAAPPANTSVRHVSQNTLAVLTGAQHIARRTSSVQKISVRHLITALYVVRLTTARPTTAADYAQTLGFPNVRESVLAYLSTVIEEDDREEWTAIVSGTWTNAELAAPGPLVAAPATDEAAPADRSVGVRTASLSDAVATRDHLGFKPYVNAVARFITNSETKAPLTLSVEGEWGSGKSSFMRQVEGVIRNWPDGKRPAMPGLPRRILAALNPRYDPGPLTVWFNPWRHDREEAMWAAFALEFLRNISGELPWTHRWRGHFKLLRTRFSWRDGWWDVARMVALGALTVTVLLILLSVVLDNPKFLSLFTKDLQSGTYKGIVGVLLKVGGTAGVAALVVSVVKEVKSFVGNPLRVELKQYVQSPDYQARISFIEQFHGDFGKMIGAYAGGQKVYVFIDDLDRCQVPRAADLMQAINLMVTGDQPLVFIIGMDREKIAASLAVKFKDVIPFASGAESMASLGLAKVEAAAGLEYGSEFIEKFVQVSIRVPQPRENDITRLLDELSPTGHEAAARIPAAPSPTAPGAPATDSSLARAARGLPVPSMEPPIPPVGPTGEPASAGRQAMRGKVSVDSPRLHDIVRLVAPVLDYNPRRVKQFINACRLQAYIAIETGLLVADGETGPTDLTFEKLGKFVAITQRWPLLVTHLENEPGLLQRLETIAGEAAIAETDTEGFWVSRARLMELLRASDHTHAFAGLDIAQLLRVTTG